MPNWRPEGCREALKTHASNARVTQAVKFGHSRFAARSRAAPRAPRGQRRGDCGPLEPREGSAGASPRFHLVADALGAVRAPAAVAAYPPGEDGRYGLSLPPACRIARSRAPSRAPAARGETLQGRPGARWRWRCQIGAPKGDGKPPKSMRATRAALKRRNSGVLASRHAREQRRAHRVDSAGAAAGRSGLERGRRRIAPLPPGRWRAWRASRPGCGCGISARGGQPLGLSLPQASPRCPRPRVQPLEIGQLALARTARRQGHNRTARRMRHHRPSGDGHFLHREAPVGRAPHALGAARTPARLARPGVHRLRRLESNLRPGLPGTLAPRASPLELSTAADRRNRLGGACVRKRGCKKGGRPARLGRGPKARGAHPPTEAYSAPVL